MCVWHKYLVNVNINVYEGMKTMNMSIEMQIYLCACDDSADISNFILKISILIMKMGFSMEFTETVA